MTPSTTLLTRSSPPPPQIATLAISGVGAMAQLSSRCLSPWYSASSFLKDGSKLMPWMNRVIGYPAMDHIGNILNRSWTTLGGFIRTQGIVSLIDATFIGIGMVVLGVPLAGPLSDYYLPGPDSFRLSVPLFLVSSLLRWPLWASTSRPV